MKERKVEDQIDDHHKEIKKRVLAALKTLKKDIDKIEKPK